MLPVPVRRFSFLCLLLPVALFISRCDGKDEYPLPTDVQVINALPEIPSVDVFVDDARVDVPPVPFPVSSGYLRIAAGYRRISVTPSGRGANESIVTGAAALAQNRRYSLFVYSRLTEPGAVILSDTLVAPVAGQVYVRFLHLSPDTPPVDFIVFGDTIRTPAANRSFENQNRPYVSIPARVYALQLRKVGTDTTLIAQPDTVLLNSGRSYTVYLTGFAGQPGDSPNRLRLGVVENNRPAGQ